MPTRNHRVEAFVLSACVLAAGLLADPVSARPTDTSAPTAPASVTLWDQTDSGAGGAANVISQDFQPAQDAFDCEAADDFYVPAGTAWGIQTVVALGSFNGAGPPSSVDLVFYADQAGSPGAAVCAYPTQSPNIFGGDFSFALPFPCMLQPGHYWMSVQANMDSSAGNWGWRRRTIQAYDTARWRNPGNGIGTGCTTFGPVTTCLAVPDPDLLFLLAGTTAPVFPNACLRDTRTFQNGASVPIPTGPAVVTSTIEVTDLLFSIWDVNVKTYIKHTYNRDLDVTLTAPDGTVVTLTSDNGEDLDDVFNGTLWDDQADPGGQVPYDTNDRLVTDRAYVDGVPAVTLTPEEALGAFNGHFPGGTWTLTISDDLAGDGGSLDGWELTIATAQTATTNRTVFLASAAPVPIPDGPVVVTDSVVFPASFGHHVCNVKVQTRIHHTANDNLDITLTSPSQRVVTLTTDNGLSFDDVFAGAFGTLWDDAADPGGQVPYVTNDGLVTDRAYADGVAATTLVPEEPLAAFMGEDPGGEWVLTVSDDTPGDGGTLDQWGVLIRTCTCAMAEPTALNVDGHSDGGTASNVNGVFEPGETVRIEPAWKNPGVTAFDLVGNINITTASDVTVEDGSASFGPLVPGAEASCFDATGDCYAVSAANPRPGIHWDEDMVEFSTPLDLTDAPPTLTQHWKLHLGASFGDVPTSNPFYRFVETIFHNEVTGGCGGSSYCPGNQTLRKQMAVFVLKSLLGPFYTPPACTGAFTDVPCPGPFTDWIEDLYFRGIVNGCGAGPTYCPDNPVLRQQMAVFLLKTKYGSLYTPPACAGIFPDVPCSNPFAPWIEDLFSRGIAAGCSGGNYCPANPTTRGQMAPFLTKTFGLLLYGP